MSFVAWLFATVTINVCSLVGLHPHDYCDDSILVWWLLFWILALDLSCVCMVHSLHCHIWVIQLQLFVPLCVFLSLTQPWSWFWLSFLLAWFVTFVDLVCVNLLFFITSVVPISTYGQSQFSTSSIRGKLHLLILYVSTCCSSSPVLFLFPNMDNLNFQHLVSVFFILRSNIICFEQHVYLFSLEDF